MSKVIQIKINQLMVHPVETYDWYGFYGHERNASNSYDEVQGLYNGWNYSEEVHRDVQWQDLGCVILIPGCILHWIETGLALMPFPFRARPRLEW